MNYKEIAETEPFTAKTPFHMNPGWELLLENSNKNCSHSEIELLLQKRIINLIDIEIMKILAHYPYTNSNNIAFLLNHTLHQGYQKPSYLSNLNKLKRAGIILRYTFTDTSKQTDEAAATASPPVLFIPGSTYIYGIHHSGLPSGGHCIHFHRPKAGTSIIKPVPDTISATLQHLRCLITILKMH